MIDFENVSKTYKDNTVSLSNVTFSIEPGEFVSIVGITGAGKTTIVKLLLGEEKPSKGKVLFDGIPVNKLHHRDLPELRRRIGVVFQDYRLLSNKTVYENIAFAMEAAGKSDEEIHGDVPHVLELVDLANKELRFPHQLSGGEQQRLAIARAIITQPDVVIADEPTGNLDPAATYEVIQILKKINDLGTTVILTTHNKNVVDALEKRVITMENGKIIKDVKSGKYTL